MIVSRTTGTQPLLLFAAIAAAGLAVIVAGIYLFPLTIDEAYITYSHARNFARSGRLVYHPANPEFSVSTPLYALLLGLGGAVGIPIPAFSKLLGAASIFGSSVYLSLLCHRNGMIWAAITAGLLLATSPLLWQTLGLEYCFFLLLILAAFYHSDRGQFVAAAVLMACAVLTRWEGVFAAALLGLSLSILIARREGAPQGEITNFLIQWISIIPTVVLAVRELRVGFYFPAAVAIVMFLGVLLHQFLFAEKRDILLLGLSGIYRYVVLERRIRWHGLLVFAAVLAPFLLYSSVANGTPVPMAFQTQKGQGAFGFTGYGFGTLVLQGLLTMLRESLEKSPLYFLWLPLGIFGIHSLFPGNSEDAEVAELQDAEPAVAVPAAPEGCPVNNQTTWWVRAIIAWGVLQLFGFFLLELSPYPWSFVPLVPGAVLLAGLAIQRLLEWAGKPWLQALTGGGLLVCLVVAQLFLLEATASAVGAEQPPSAARTKTLSTGGGYDLYRDAGEWFRANTATEATVAASRSGIVGYFAERAMIDLSGSLQLEVAQGLKRSDPFFAILALLPDYLVLEDTHFIYNIWQKGNSWLVAHYYEVRRFTAENEMTLPGPSLVVLRRVDDVRQWDSSTLFAYDWQGYISYPPVLKFARMVIYGTDLRPGSWMHVKLDCEAEPAESDFAFRDGKTTSFVIADMDGAIVAEQYLESAMTTYFSRRWREHESFATYVQILLPEDLASGTYQFGVSNFSQRTKKKGYVFYMNISVGSGADG